MLNTSPSLFISLSGFIVVKMFVFQRFLAEDVADCKMRAILISLTVKTVKNHKGIYLWRWENHKQTMRTTSKA